MTKITSFDDSSLKSIIDEATFDTDPAEWASQFMSGAAGMLAKSPIMYRSFGPYWWSLKKHMLDAGLIDGEPVDDIQFQEVTLGDIISDLAAAFAFHDITTREMSAHLQTRTVQSIDGSIDYTLNDDEMEAAIVAKSM